MTDRTPSLRVVRHESERAWWELASRRADRRLRAHVREYHGFAEVTDGPVRRLEIPRPAVVLVVSLGGPLQVIDPRTPATPIELHGSFVVGPSDAYGWTETRGSQRGVQVTFTPVGAYRFFGVPMSELTNRLVALEDLLGADARRLEAQLAEAADWEARFQHVDVLVAERLGLARPVALGVARAWQRLWETDGSVDIAGLAAEVGWSRKQLAIRFHEQVGLPPKRLARLLRFWRAILLMEAETDLSWAEIAPRCGYYDQAHCIRDFRQFAGLTPAEFRRRRQSAGPGLAVD